MNTDTDKYGSMLNVNSVILPIHWRKKRKIYGEMRKHLKHPSTDDVNDKLQWILRNTLIGWCIMPRNIHTEQDSVLISIYH